MFHPICLVSQPHRIRFARVVLYVSMPIHSLPFQLPETYLYLCMVYTTDRSYGICGAVVAHAASLISVTVTAVSVELPADWIHCGEHTIACRVGQCQHCVTLGSIDCMVVLAVNRPACCIYWLHRYMWREREREMQTQITFRIAIKSMNVYVH